MAEEARREGTPGGEVEAASGPEADMLNNAQLAILGAGYADDRPDTAPPSAAGPVPDAAGSSSEASVSDAAAVFVHASVPALEVPPLATHPKAPSIPQGRIRRFNGNRRTRRVGPVGFTEEEHAELLSAAERHGYQGTLSGYMADIALAFIRGAFTVELPLHTERQEVQEFRAKIRYEINRIGVNINQMVYVLHRDDRIEPDIRERLERLDRMLTYIARALLLPTDSTDSTGSAAP